MSLRATAALALALALMLVAGACGGTDADFPEAEAAPAPGPDRVTTSTLRTIPEEATSTTRRTIPEEAPTTTIATTTTVEEPQGPPPEPAWLDQELQLFTLATVDYPTALTGRSGGDDLWLTERDGRVRQIQRRLSLDEREQTLRLMNTVVLDITDRVTTAGEGGLLGLAFSSNGQHLYVSYTNRSGNTVVAEYEMGVITALPDTERILIEVDQPFSNHNGGQIHLGPDGFLYLALGDGGSAGDPLGHGQNTGTLLGSILRIDPADPSEDSPYAIPADNPFADGEGGRPEIWLWGVRNPWRFAFDALTGDLWIADVGQNALEEITVLPRTAEPAGRGANLGWATFEGDRPFDGPEPPPGHAPPIFTYDHSNGRCSITGGHVYRGGHITDLDGVYLFGDFCTGEMFGLDRLEDGRLIVANLLVDRAPGQIVSFGEGPDGEHYLLESNGRVSLIRRPGAGPRVRVVDSDEAIPGGEIDDSVEPNPDPNAEG